nr:GLUG motif-containing protein [uncultured Prevotella sp.]
MFGFNSGTIKNVGVINSYFGWKYDRTGGICGENSGTIENCYNEGKVEGKGDDTGGICARNFGTITNCYNLGTVIGEHGTGGVCGYTYDNGTITNCYYLSGTATGGINGEDATGSAEVKTQEQFGSGEVCYLLNGSRSEGTEENPLAWYQNISPSSRDLYPVLTGTGTNTVYQVKILCGGTVDVGKAYSNTNKDIIVEHILPESPVFNSDKKIYSKICQREGCGKTFYYADAASTIEATPNAEETAFAVASYTLADANPYDNQAVFTATSLAYKRTFYDDKWMAVYVPFAIDCSQLDADYEMATINNFHEYEQEDGTYKVVLEVKRVTKGSTIPALTPCLMRMKTAPEKEVEKTLTFENAEFSAAADKSIDCSSVTRYYQFFGTLSGKTGLTAATDFVLNAGKLYKTSENTVLLPQRWYLSATDRTSTPVEPATMLRSISINVIGDGEATGIEDIHVNTESGADALSGTGIYDLQGRKINSEPTKGMYIKNGKKYIK